MADTTKPGTEPTDMREQILKAATSLFAGQGYDATSLQSIADQVGIRKASVLYHFPSKQALHQSVLLEILSRWNEQLPAVMLAVTGSKRRFEATIHAVVDFFAADPNRARLLLREMLDRPEAMRRIMREHSKVWVQTLASTLREGQQSGVVPADMDPEAWVVQVVNLVLGLATMQPLSVMLAPDAEDDGKDQADALPRLMREIIRVAEASLFEERDNRTL